MMTLPFLVGSDAQVKWAEDLRERAIEQHPGLEDTDVIVTCVSAAWWIEYRSDMRAEYFTECPSCSAPVGSKCRTSAGKETTFHRPRYSYQNMLDWSDTLLQHYEEYEAPETAPDNWLEDYDEYTGYVSQAKHITCPKCGAESYQKCRRRRDITTQKMVSRRTPHLIRVWSALSGEDQLRYQEFRERQQLERDGQEALELEERDFQLQVEDWELSRQWQKF